MLSRGVTQMGRKAGASQPARGMATAQALRQRVTAVKNIQKITNAMKMVAVCKLRGAQDRLTAARAYASTMNDVDFTPKEAPEVSKELWIPVSSDRGLCGGINSGIARGTRDSIFRAQDDGVTDILIMPVGEKGKQGIATKFAKDIQFAITDISKNQPCSFKQVAEITDMWQQFDYQKSSVYYQAYKSMISYVTTQSVFFKFDFVKDEISEKLAEYEIEGDPDTLENYYEFKQCVMLNQYFAENETSTLSSRMSAMDNSSSAAKDMIEALELLVNRSRQAKITNELSEIISGSAAVDDAA